LAESPPLADGDASSPTAMVDVRRAGFTRGSAGGFPGGLHGRIPQATSGIAGTPGGGTRVDKVGRSFDAGSSGVFLGDVVGLF